MLRLDRPTLTIATTNVLARWTPCLETELHTLRELVGRGDVCLEVGSAAGLYSQALAHLVGLTGLVHSVEPLSFSHPVWSRVLGAWERSNVVRHAVALGSEPGQAVMRVPFGHYGPASSLAFLARQTHNLGSTADYPHHVDVLVETETLDGLRADVGRARLDFVKIDVEGGELHVLQDGQQTIEQFRPTMLIEIEARHTERYAYSPDDVVRWLTDRGYSMYAPGGTAGTRCTGCARTPTTTSSDQPRPTDRETAAAVEHRPGVTAFDLAGTTPLLRAGAGR